MNPDKVINEEQLPQPVDAATPSVVLTLPIFKGSAKDFSTWLERFFFCLRLNKITDSTDKRAVLICSLSPSVQNALVALCAPAGVLTLSFEVLMATLNAHYSLEMDELFQYLKLFSLKQPAGMATEDFTVKIRQFASNCTWPLTRDRALVIAFTLGVKDKDLKAELLMESYESLELALEHARRFEAVREAEKLLTSRRSSAELSNSFDNQSGKGGNKGNNSTNSSCIGCGRSDHARAACPFKDAFCRACGKKAHIAEVCRSKPFNRYRP